MPNDTDRNYSIHKSLNLLLVYMSKNEGNLSKDEKEKLDLLKVYVERIKNEIGNAENTDYLNENIKSEIIPLARHYSQNNNTEVFGNIVARLEDLLGILYDKKTESTNKNIQKEFEKLIHLNKVYSEKIKEFDKKSEHALQKISDKADKNNEEFNQYILQWQKEFHKSQENKNSEFDKLKSDIDDSLKDKLEILNENIKQIHEEHKNKIEYYIEEAEKNYNKILELQHLSARDSVAGGYENNADKEGDSAKKWRRGSILFIVASSAWLVSSFLWGQGAESWRHFIMSFSLTGVLLYGAAYCAQQSTRHRNIEVHNRKFSLEMAAIDPYLKSLNEDDQKEVKKELTKRFFGQEGEGETSSVLDEHATKRVLESIRENFIEPLK